MKTWISRIGLLTSLALAAFRIDAAELKPETVQAWDSYIESTEAGLNARLIPGHTFLWAEEDPKRLGKLRQGAVQVAPVNGTGLQAAPNGLIHDWIGAIFIPNTSLSQVIDLARDYDHYKDIYQPLVVQSKVIDRSGDLDHFSMRWVHKALFVTAAMETEYSSRTVRVNDHECYTIYYTTRVQDIQGYGTPGERKMPLGQGSGFVWKLYSVIRYKESDGGVYVELEAVVLTRDIPGSVRFMVKPVVTKLSRNSLLVSLTQTRDAMQSHPARVNVPAEITQKSGNESFSSNHSKNSAVSFIHP